MASEIAQYEKRFRESEARRVMIECEVAARGYEVEAMYQSLLDQEKVHMETINMFQQIVDHIPMPIFWKDLDGKYLGCNKSYEQESGFTIDVVKGKDSSEIYPDDFTDVSDYPGLEGLSGPALFNRADDFVKSKGYFVYKTRIKFSGGDYVPTIFYKCLYYDLNNNPVGIISFAHTRCDGSLCP
jgi:PAS domain-containing protein